MDDLIYFITIFFILLLILTYVATKSTKYIMLEIDAKHKLNFEKFNKMNYEERKIHSLYPDQNEYTVKKNFGCGCRYE